MIYIFSKIRFNKIWQKFAFISILIIIIVLSVSSLVTYYFDIKASEEALKIKLSRISNLVTLSVSESMWSYNEESINDIGNAIIKDPEVIYLSIEDDIQGVLFEKSSSNYSQKIAADALMKEAPIKYNQKKIGNIKIVLTNFEQLKTLRKNLIFQIIEIVISIILLSIAIIYISTTITRPLKRLEEATDEIAAGNYSTKINISSNDETSDLASKFEKMAANIKTNKEQLKTLNASLEEKVKKRTKELSFKKSELEKNLKELKATQKKLIEKEKMAALGSLVAGVAHEINTPIGTSYTGVSNLEKENVRFLDKLEEGTITKDDLINYLNLVTESTEIIHSSLEKASQLINSFKKIAVDQSNLNKTAFNIKEYIDTIILSLKHELKNHTYTIDINCPDSLEIESYPGDFSQIFTNLIMNTLYHGYSEEEHIEINIDVRKKNNQIEIVYKDYGKGISNKNIKNIFDPFFSTRTHGNSSGLGLNIIYNIVTQKFNGSISCSSVKDEYTEFKIVLPT